eukprot:365470-Chlamydomonas_euryale.AAC.9
MAQRPGGSLWAANTALMAVGRCGGGAAALASLSSSTQSAHLAARPWAQLSLAPPRLLLMMLLLLLSAGPAQRGVRAQSLSPAPSVERWCKMEKEYDDGVHSTRAPCNSDGTVGRRTACAVGAFCGVWRGRLLGGEGGARGRMCGAFSTQCGK